MLETQKMHLLKRVGVVLMQVLFYESIYADMHVVYTSPSK